jgi:hypothetical protein
VANTSETTPVSPVSGQIWFDPSDTSLSVYYNDGDSSQWVTISGPQGPQGFIGFTGSRGFAGSRGLIGFIGSRGTNGTNGTLANTSETTPISPVSGQIWFDPNDTTLSVYYNDGDSSQWVVTSGPSGPSGITGYTGSRGFAGSRGLIGYNGSKGVTGTLANTSETTPISPVSGQIWFDPNDTSLSVYYSDGDSSQWVTISGPQGPQGQSGSPIGAIISTSTSRLFALTDANSMIFSTSSVAVSFTIPLDSNVNFPIGSVVHITRDGAGSVTIENQVGVTVRIRNGLSNQLAVQYSTATATKISANYWYLSGDLA